MGCVHLLPVPADLQHQCGPSGAPLRLALLMWGTASWFLTIEVFHVASCRNEQPGKCMLLADCLRSLFTALWFGPAFAALDRRPNSIRVPHHHAVHYSVTVDVLARSAHSDCALQLLFLFLTLAFALLSAGPTHPRVTKVSQAYWLSM